MTVVFREHFSKMQKFKNKKKKRKHFKIPKNKQRNVLKQKDK